MTCIFISHSHSDEAITFKLVQFLMAALVLKQKEILCTSNPDQGLSYSSSSITDQLKDQLKNSEALIILITADSLHSAWIPFEAGSFWTTDKLIIPILGPGLTQKDMPGPLKNLLLISIDAQDWEEKLSSATNQLAKNLNLQQEVTKIRNYTLQEFSNALRAWQSQRPMTDLSQQREIAELEAQIQNLERSHSDRLKKIELAYQQEKQELEQKLQEERSQFAKQLEELERSYKQKLAEIKAAFPQEKEQKSSQSTTTSIFVAELDSFRFEIEIVDHKGEVIGRDSNKLAKFFKEDLGNSISLEMVYIPGGKFLMGTEDEEIERLIKKFNKDFFRREKPQHEVTVQPFFMGKFQITQEQWKAIASLPKVKRDLEPNPSHFKGDKLPVEKVSWEDVVEFCQRLSNQTGKEYRLPSEAEWEYACRAGTTTAFNCGATITSSLANYDGTKIYANEPKGKYRETTIQVGSFPPNAFGLYDMHGNVWEWCQDNWHSNYIGAPKDGSVWSFGDSSKKVVRSGSWYYLPSFSRSAYRGFYTRDYRNDGFGVRVVCVAPRTT